MDVDSVPADLGGTPRSWLDERFEALVFDWDAMAVDWQQRGVGDPRRAIGDLCAAGMVIAVVAGASVDDLGSQLASRPSNGRLLLCPSGGSDLFEIDEDGSRRAGRPSLTVEEGGPPLQSPAAAVGGLDGERLDAVFRALWRRGISPGGALVVPGALSVQALHGLLENQLNLRSDLRPPSIRVLAGWTLTVQGQDPLQERALESVLTLADGRFGTRGSPFWEHEDPIATPRMLASGVFAGEAREARLVSGPRWNHLPAQAGEGQDLRRTLDLRGGTLEQVQGGARALAFSSLARPGVVALRAEGLAASSPGPALLPPLGGSAETGHDGDAEWMRVAPGPGAVLAAATESRGVGTIERFVAYTAATGSAPEPEDALTRLSGVRALGFEALLEEHRIAWARRWDHGDLEVEGNDQLRLAVRFCLFHLMASVASEGEAAVGPRGVSGDAYRGHVFWDAEVFVLPYLVATHPPAARAMLEYRVRRLDAAIEAARRAGRSGARFPWESALTGEDVTPMHLHDAFGKAMAIRSGLLEAHIVADVAWGAALYEDWTGDREFADGPGLRLLVETARYWASRVRLDRHDRAHIYGVMGPDEYHEAVDDNAFTNVMARWNLRRAAGRVRALGHPEEAERWLELADRLVDGHDPGSGVYEQFAGFLKLEPLIVAEAAPRRPVAADLLFGSKRVAGSQVIKQADVLMLHHLVPDEVAAGSLRPNLAFYEPRTAHGSSLSPAVHAALLARAGRLEEAVAMLDVAARLDLDDLTGTTAGGLHIACMGGVWQALVFGFMGARMAEGVLHLAPIIPEQWRSLRAALTVRGTPVVVKAEPERLQVDAEEPLAVDLGGTRFPPKSGRRVFRHTSVGWNESHG